MHSVLDLVAMKGFGTPSSAAGGQLASSLETTPDLFCETGSQAGASGFSREMSLEIPKQTKSPFQWSLLN